MEKLYAKEIELQLMLRIPSSVKLGESNGEQCTTELEIEVYMEKEKVKLLHDFIEKELTMIIDKHQENKTELREQVIKQSDVLIAKENYIKKLQEQINIEKDKKLSLEERLKRHVKEKEDIESKVNQQNSLNSIH